jgi:hypothetical protein
MARVRDKAILHWTMIASGKMKGEQAEHDALDRLDADGRQSFLALVPAVVDTVLHHLLWTVEQNEKIQLVMVARDGSVTNLNDMSDGLAGELYSERGWIARFSEAARP